MTLLGKTEPRLFTPPLRPLDETTSFGFEVIEFAREVLGVRLHPWQEWLMIHSLELEEGSFTYDPAPVLRYRTVVVEVARQNGKSFMLAVRMLWRMYLWEREGVAPPLVLGTAHKLSLSEELLDQTHHMIKRSPELADTVAKRSNVNGLKFIELDNGARYKCEAASDDGGRGLTVTDLGFDELRQQRDWNAWAAMSNTTNAVESAQTIAVSNAGEAKSEVLRSFRAQGLAAIDVFNSGSRPDDVSLGWFEWSAPDDADIYDREGWAQANPSLGYPHGPTERTLASLAAMVGLPGVGLPEHKFRTENLCQWVDVAVEGPFQEADLTACKDAESFIADESPVVIAVDTSADRSMSYAAVAGYRPDGIPHVEVIDQRAYTEWIPKYLSESLAFTPNAVVVQGKGAPISSVIDFIEAEGVEVTRCQASDLPAACGQFADRVIQHSVRWGDQPVLENALAVAAQKRYGDVWSWDRDKSPADIAPLCAVTFALWGLYNVKENVSNETAYGEDYGDWWNE